MWSSGKARARGAKAIVSGAALALVASTAISGAVLAQEERSINVAVVGNPQMQDIALLTPDLFTAETGIEVNYTILEEQQLREITTRDVGAGGGQFDVVMIGMFEAPQFGRNGWLVDLNQFAEGDEEYDLEDIFPAVRNGLSYEGALYAAPFYAESSLLMYRKDVLDEAGIEIPKEPTWDEVAEIARQIDTDEMAGICLRGLPGWGDLGGPLGTVINTFGATWWLAGENDTIGESQVDQPEFAEAVNFWVDLLADAGQEDAANSSYNECTQQVLNGNAAMWYDASVAAASFEADDSPVKGKMGYALAPTKLTDNAGWLWAWSLAIPASAPDPETSWEFIRWATGPEYLATAGDLLPGGWASLPPGTRASLYENPKYQEAAAAFADITLEAMEKAPIDNPGLQPRPGLPGIQFVGVGQFQAVGTACTEQISGAIAGNISVDDALAACDAIASEVEGEEW